MSFQKAGADIVDAGKNVVDASGQVVKGVVDSPLQFLSQVQGAVSAVDSGNLLASCSNGQLSVVLGSCSALATTAPWISGAANMKGSPLPPLPENGSIDVTFTQTTCVLTIKDSAGLIIHVWSGAGTQSGLVGSFSGSWVRLAN